MSEKGKETPVGLTKDVGFQIGVRRTLPICQRDAWQLLTSQRGLSIWLGEVSKLNIAKGSKYQLPDGTEGEIRVYKQNSHLRITWHPPVWQRSSTIQLRVIPKGDRTVVAFHQEHLPGVQEREERRVFFAGVIERLEGIILDGVPTK
jgi:uncharacterized protein YndB with AHSA1/START domain